MTECLFCEKNYLDPISHTCVSSCPKGYLENSDKNICEKCSTIFDLKC